MRSNNNRCSSCSQVFLSLVTLDCGHSICPACIEALLKQQEEHERLLDELEIECSSCSYVTQIAIALAYKIARPLRDSTLGSHWKHCRSMVCMDCLDGCFPIDDYLAGEHSAHQVLPITQTYNKIKDVLFYQEKRLEEAVSQCELQGERLVHCKTMLNDVLNANAVKIKVAFENLKEQITRKEMEALDFYQERIQGLFASIDEALVQSRKKGKLCQHHLHSISEKVPNIPHNCINNELMFETITYYIQNQHKIATLTQKPQDQTLPCLMEELQENRKIINLQQMRKIQKSIRILEVFKTNEKTATVSTCSLSREYFDTKRKEVFNSTPPQSTYCKLKPFEHFRSMRHLQSYHKKETTNQKIEDLRQKLKGSSIRHH